MLTVLSSDTKTSDSSVGSNGNAARDNSPETAAAVSVRSLYKFFGGDIQQAMSMSRAGVSKDEIQAQTGAVAALTDVSFDVSAGELFVVMGLSGCGKSTLVRCINRLIEPDSGQVWLDDQEVTAMDDEELRQVRRTQLAMVFQHYGLLPHRTVLDNVGWGLELNGVEKRARVDVALEAIEAVGLDGWERRMPDELSGGMKQRVGLARALAVDAPVMLMDEPFSALDPVIRRDLQDELVQMQEKVQKTIIFITHDLSEAVRIGNRVAIMRDGAIVQIDSPTEVVLNPRDAFVRDFTRDVRQHSLMTAESVMSDPTHVVRDERRASEVLENLIEDDQSYALVVNEGGKYVGTALLQRISRAVRMGDVQIGDVPLQVDDAVMTDTILDALVPSGLRSDHSVPVLDESGVLVGEVHLETLAAAMESEMEESDAEAHRGEHHVR